MPLDGPNYLGAGPERIQGFWRYLNDYKNGEERLLVRVNRALSTIEAEAPSLAASRAPAPTAEPTKRRLKRASPGIELLQLRREYIVGLDGAGEGREPVDALLNVAEVNDLDR